MIGLRVEKNENNEKLVKFSVEVCLSQYNNEKIIVDLLLTKQTYLQIAKELFN